MVSLLKLMTALKEKKKWLTVLGLNSVKKERKKKASNQALGANNVREKSRGLFNKCTPPTVLVHIKFAPSDHE